jgi:uncharacterized protein (DUF1501 family)
MNRRDILKYGGALGLLGALPMIRTRTARAAGSGTPRRLILVLAQGGWDTTYSVDPKTGSDYVDVPAGSIQSFGNNLNVFTDSSRPNIAAFFTKYAAQTALVQGISVASVAHSECVKRICTGTRQETSADMAAIVGHDTGNTLPLPYLILGDSAFTGPYAVSAGRVGPTNQILALLDPKQAYATDGNPAFATTDTEDGYLKAYASASATRARQLRAQNGYNLDRVNDFEAAVTSGKNLTRYSSAFGKRGNTLKLVDQIPLAISALSGGVSQAVMLNTRLHWDTHTQNSDQNGFHDQLFAAMTTLLDSLTSASLISDTVVVVCSEMGRTPKLNSNAGKDHWPVTTAMVMGAGVKGGFSYGGTDDEMKQLNIDYATGQPSDSGQPLTFSNFAAGVLSLCGVDPSLHLSSTPVFDVFAA